MELQTKPKPDASLKFKDLKPGDVVRIRNTSSLFLVVQSAGIGPTQVVDLADGYLFGPGAFAEAKFYPVAGALVEEGRC